MSDPKSARRPGDLLLDRYFKDADEKTREEAREAFREFARALEELGEEVLERQEQTVSFADEAQENPETLRLPL